MSRYFRQVLVVFLVLAVLLGLCGCSAELGAESAQLNEKSPEVWGVFEVVDKGYTPSGDEWKLLRYSETGQLYYYEWRTGLYKGGLTIVQLESADAEP